MSTIRKKVWEDPIHEAYGIKVVITDDGYVHLYLWDEEGNACEQYVPTQELRDFLNGVERSDFKFKPSGTYR